MSGQFTASDIWSLSCTVIEVLTSEPPYGKLTPMAAMFHVVQDDYPPFPVGISEDCQDFMRLCFHKNPEERPTAAKLLEHSWLRFVKEEDLDLQGIKTTVSDYNRRPTIFSGIVPDTRQVLESKADGFQKEDLDNLNDEIQKISTQGVSTDVKKKKKEFQY